MTPVPFVHCICKYNRRRPERLDRETPPPVPIYYVLPDVDLSLETVLPGAVVAAVGWAFLEGSFGIYARYSSTQGLYGVVGGIVLLITFLYFGALVILIGAVANGVLARRRRTGAVERQVPH